LAFWVPPVLLEFFDAKRIIVADVVPDAALALLLKEEKSPLSFLL
jgi:hypothetical protein